MSQRGAFCTEYMYCNPCALGVSKYLETQEASSTVELKTIIGREGHILIIAAKLHTGYEGEEFWIAETIEHDLGPFLCPGHSVLFAVMGEDVGGRFYKAQHE